MSAFHRILVAVKDPWARSIPAIDKAVQLARAYRARLQLFHGMSEPVYVDLSEIRGADLEQAHRSRVARRFEVIRRRLERSGITASSAVEWDYPAHEAVIRAARRFGADLIVAERHAASHHLSWLLRFTDFELLRFAPVPVLLVKTPQPYVRPPILAAIDPSRAHGKPVALDRQILRYAAELASALCGSLHAVHAFDPLPIGSMAMEAPLREATQEIQATLEARARATLNRVLHGSGIPPSRRHLIPRHPTDAIGDVAREIGSSIVVMGALSRSGLKRLVLGNTAQRVFDHLPCDILVVKPTRLVSRVPRATRGAQLVALSPIQTGY